MKKNLRIGWIIGGSLLVVMAAFVAVWWARLPAAAEQLNVFFASSMSIDSPADGGILFLADPFSIDVNAATKKPVNHFELWVDGVQASSTISEPGASEMFMYSFGIFWLPDKTGEHTLIVRAVGSGWTMDSNAVRVNVVDLAAAMSGSQYFPGAGETLGSVAANFGLPPMLLAVANPQIPGLADPLSPNHPVLIPDLPVPVDQNPQDPPPGMYEGPTPDPAPPAVSRLRTWFDLNIAIRQPVPPAAPTLFRWKEGCDVRWYVRDNSDNELGFFVYRLNPGSSSFIRVRAFGAHSGAEFFSFLETGLYGAFDYYVSAYNATGETPSNISHVFISYPACGSSDPTAMMVARVTLKPAQVVDKAYCYYSLQEGSWSRYPLDPNAFVYPTDHGFDLSRMLENMVLSPGSPISVECWGWSGGALLPLGTASGQVAATPGDSPLGGGGQPFDLDIKISSIDWSGFAPVMPAGLGDLSIVKIAPPYNLARTVTLETCANHFIYGYTVASRTACADAITAKMNILVWDWDPTCSGCTAGDYLPPSAITGYKIYESDGSYPPHLVATTTTGPWQTVFFLPQSYPAPDTPRRYFVRAYSGPYSSPNSNVHTWSDLGDGILSLTVYPTISTDEVKDEEVKCIFPDDLPSFGLPSFQTVVGYQHLYSSGCGYSAHYYRGRLAFDLGGAKGHLIYNSFLTYIQDYGVSSVPGQSCAASMFTVTSSGSSGSLGTSLLQVLPAMGTPGLGFSINITGTVDGWARGLKPNLGLLMVGRNETLPKTENDSCWTRYRDFMLKVLYFK